MRISSGGILLLGLMACGPSGSGTVTTAAPSAATAAAPTPTPSPTPAPTPPPTAASTPLPADGKIACAPNGATDFARSCTFDRTTTTDGLVLTMRHPDGGFRRLLVVTDGRGVVAADGAEAVRVTVIGAGEIEAAVGSVRYRLPAQIQI